MVIVTEEWFAVRVASRVAVRWFSDAAMGLHLAFAFGSCTCSLSSSTEFSAGRYLYECTGRKLYEWLVRTGFPCATMSRRIRLCRKGF